MSASVAIKLIQRVRATGSAAPARYGGHRAGERHMHRITRAAAGPNVATNTATATSTAHLRHCGYGLT